MKWLVLLLIPFLVSCDTRSENEIYDSIEWRLPKGVSNIQLLEMNEKNYNDWYTFELENNGIKYKILMHRFNLGDDGLESMVLLEKEPIKAEKINQ